MPNLLRHIYDNRSEYFTKKDEKIDAGFPSGNCFSNFGHLGVSATGNVTLVNFVKYHQDLFLGLPALLVGDR